MVGEHVHNEVLDKLQTLSPESFVALIVEHLERRADFSDVKPGPEKGTDRQVDITAKTSSATGETLTVVFQCKRYISKTLGSSEVAETAQGLLSREADEAVIVSTRSPTDGARVAIEEWRRRGIRITWEAWCGRGLVNTLVEITPSVLLQRFPDLTSLLPRKSEYETLCPSFEVVVPPPVEGSLKADKFYDGNVPDWQDLQNNFDIERSIYVSAGGIRESIFNLLGKEAGLNTVALLGVGGTGKSTLLRRAGLDAAKAGYLVLRLHDDWIAIKADLSRQIKDVAKERQASVLVLIDDASELAANNYLGGMIRELEELKSVVLVLAEHPDRWSLITRRISSFVRGVNYYAFIIHRLLQSESEALVDRILQYELDGTLAQSYCELSREERLMLCQEASDRQLVVAMFQMRHGMRFRNIIQREYDRIPLDSGKDAYAMVCHFNTYRTLIPQSLLLRSLNIVTPTAVQQFRDSVEGLFIENRLGFAARHSLIARVVYLHALSRPEERKAALQIILSALDLNNEREESIFLQIFSGPNAYRWLVTQLGRDPDLIRAFYYDLRKSHTNLPPYYRKFLASSQAMAERLLGYPDEARKFWEEAIQLDPKFAFAHRQYAWLEHSRGNWNEAAARAIHAAEIAPDNFLCNYHCGRILSLNTVDNFRRAKRYLERALSIEPENVTVSRALAEYQAAEHILQYVDNLIEDDLIPGYVFRDLRPGLSFLRALHGPDSKFVRQQLKSELQGMEEESRGTVDDLYEKVGDIEIGESPQLRALFTCNLARLKYLEWYNRSEPHDPDEIEKLFQVSMELNNKDPLTHCWYGTFLKEMKKDFVGARLEYEKAVNLGNESKNKRFNDHPLFLNNIALLIMDEFHMKMRQPDSLQEAKALLERAVAKVEETESNFYWPVVSLSLCLELIKESESIS